MTAKSTNKPVIAICVQELTEDGSEMELGAINGDELRFLHQAFISDSIVNALKTPDADIRLYYRDEPDRVKLVGIVTEYLNQKLKGREKEAYTKRFSSHMLPDEPWGMRVEKTFKDCFESGYTQVYMIGSRTPTITSGKFSTALRMLQDSDAVFGPTPEGRYYSIGMSGKCVINLSEYDWRSNTIYHDVADAFTEKKLSWAELEIWYAVESVDELELMVRDINQFRREGKEDLCRETEAVLERLLSKLE